MNRIGLTFCPCFTCPLYCLSASIIPYVLSQLALAHQIYTTFVFGSTSLAIFSLNNTFCRIILSVGCIGINIGYSVRFEAAPSNCKVDTVSSPDSKYFYHSMAHVQFHLFRSHVFECAAPTSGVGIIRVGGFTALGEALAMDGPRGKIGVVEIAANPVYKVLEKSFLSMVVGIL